MPRAGLQSERTRVASVANVTNTPTPWAPLVVIIPRFSLARPPSRSRPRALSLSPSIHPPPPRRRSRQPILSRTLPIARLPCTSSRNPRSPLADPHRGSSSLASHEDHRDASPRSCPRLPTSSRRRWSSSSSRSSGHVSNRQESADDRLPRIECRRGGGRQRGHPAAARRAENAGRCEDEGAGARRADEVAPRELPPLAVSRETLSVYPPGRRE